MMRASRWAWVAGCVGIAAVMLWPVTTRQGINYQVSERTIPAYAKAVHFLSRSITFRRMARDITAGARTDQERAEKILTWVMDHIHRGTPEGLSVIDDHVLNVAIRGYGTDDQLSDLVTVLCAYAGIPAIRLILLATEDIRYRLAVCVVKIDGQWRYADPYHRFIPRHPDGTWMTVDSVVGDPLLVAEQAGDVTFKDQPYLAYLRALTPVEEPPFLRAWRQVPSKRVWYELARLWQRVTPAHQGNTRTSEDL